MNETRGFADRFGQIRGERNDIVIGSLLDLVDSGDGEFRATLDLFQRVPGNSPHLGMDFADGDFHIQPLLKPGLFRPESAHFRQGVAINHGFISARWKLRSTWPDTSGPPARSAQTLPCLAPFRKPSDRRPSVNDPQPEPSMSVLPGPSGASGCGLSPCCRGVAASWYANLPGTPGFAIRQRLPD